MAEITPQILYQTFSQTQYAKILLHQARFNTGSIKPEWMSTEDWTALLGPDVNNLWHLQHSVNVVVMYQILSQGENPENICLL